MNAENWNASKGSADPLGSVLNELERRWPEMESDDGPLEEQFQTLAAAGILGWVIPEEYGGTEVPTRELNSGYLELSEACLTTAFVLTQRNGACQRLARSENEQLKARLLPALCSGEMFATVGISHLTTSSQHLGRPAVGATRQSGHWLLDGMVPWITAGTMADSVVIGATCGDGTQLLLSVDTDLPGMEMTVPPQLMSMNGSRTGALRLNNVKVDDDLVIAGPVEQVMQSGVGAGTGSVTTSALALGLARRALRTLADEAVQRTELEEIVARFEAEWRTAVSLFEANQDGSRSSTPSSNDVRERANSLVLRVTQACLAACKGRGFMAGHPAERLVREAMFFLVWSCPQPVLAAALQELACSTFDS